MQTGDSPSIVKFANGTSGPETPTSIDEFRLKCRQQADDGRPIMGGQGNMPTSSSIKYWPRLQTDIEDAICQELAAHPEYGISESVISAWFCERPWVIDDHEFTVIVGQHFTFRKSRAENDAFSNIDRKMEDRGLPVPGNKSTWGLRSWSVVNAEGKVPSVLISHEADDSHLRFAKATLGILASLAERPLFCLSQATALAWDCYAVALHAKDAVLLLGLCGEATKKSASVKCGKDVVDLKLFQRWATTSIYAIPPPT